MTHTQSMSRYTTLHTIAPELPDGRLVRVSFTTNGRGLHCVAFEYRDGHIDPELLRDFAEMSRHLSHTAAFALDATLVGTPPVWQGWIQRIPPKQMGPLSTIGLRAVRVDGRLLYEVRCRADLISPPLAEELSGSAFPELNGMLPRVVSQLRQGLLVSAA
jgi:hypothetical protein